jgi:hypothetical protein
MIKLYIGDTLNYNRFDQKTQHRIFLSYVDNGRYNPDAKFIIYLKVLDNKLRKENNIQSDYTKYE